MVGNLILLKLVAEQLAETISCIVISALNNNIFPSKAEEAGFTPVDKGGHDKHRFPNYESNHSAINFTNELLSIFYWAYYCNQYKTKHTQQNLSKTYILSSDYSCKTESNSRNGRKPGHTLANKSRKAGKYKAGAP